jgi:superfamily II DNA or RNA helicase
VISLRDYQLGVMNGIRFEFSQGRQRVLCVAPTGAGKGVLNGYIAEGAVKRGKRIYTLVHRNELVDQLSEKLHAFGVSHGIIASGKTLTHQMAQVASVQTLIRRLDKIPPPDLIVVDESHHLTAGTIWGRILDAWDKASVIGLTATPQRLDGKGLGVSSGGYFETMVKGPKVSWLIEQGHLSKFKLYAPPAGIDLSGVRTRAGDFAKDELEARVNKSTITGDAVDHYRRLCPKAQGIVFCVSRAHSIAVAGQFRAAGITAAYLDGDTPKEERRDTLAAFRAGRIQVLTNCELFTEGFDVPGIEAVQLLRPTKSFGLWRQMIGRALRPAPGKAFAYVLDHVGGTEEHGLPDDEPEWSLDGRQKKKRGADEERAFAVRTCPDCFGVHAPAPACPYCGHQYAIKGRELEMVDGELKEITDEDRERIKWLRRKEVSSAKTLEELEKIAEARGYKKNWAKIQLEIKEKYKRGRLSRMGI